MQPERHFEPLILERDAEWPQVQAWRLCVLIEAGYPVLLAEALAERSYVDLHQAVELVAHGCECQTAAEILL